MNSKIYIDSIHSIHFIKKMKYTKINKYILTIDNEIIMKFIKTNNYMMLV
jgi:hypothetical protein